MLWILFGLVTAATLALLLWPLLKPPAAGDTRARHDIEVYRDQLKEIEADRTRGEIAGADAEAARREIERRLLRAGDEIERGRTTQPRQALAAALAIAVLVPVGAVGLYLKLGQPHIPAQPFASRDLPRGGGTAAGNVAEMTAKLAERLQQNPGDQQGWMLLGRSYMQLERFDDAAMAYGKAAALAPDDVNARMGAAETQVYAAGGTVTPKAEAAFKELLALDPQHPGARYYLALARGQAGDMQGAFDGWKALAADSAPDAPWQSALQARLKEAAEKLKIDPPPAVAAASPPGSAPKGPTQEQMQAAAQMSPEDRNAMIRGMVEGLAARLKDNPNDAEGWTRLARAYDVLGEGAKATEARAKADAAGKSAAAAPSAAKGPTAEQMQAASKMSAEDRQAMIRGMVEGLAAKLKDNPNDREGWVRLARSYEVLNEPEKAKEAWAKAELLAAGQTLSAVPPPDPTTPSAGTLAQPDKAEMERLVAQLEERLKRQPEDVEGWSRLGQARLMMGQPKQARAAFEEALKRKPNDVDLLVDQASAILDDEGTTGPIPPAADAIYRKVLALAPENLDALWYVGVAELQAGRRDVAQVYWERLLGKLEPGSTEAKQVQEAIGNLKKR